jgi:hypothetical protein
LEIIITVDGTSVGGYEDSNTPNDAKQKAEIIIPSPRIRGLAMTIPRMRPIAIGTKDMKSPKRKEAKISPSRIPHIVIGVVSSLSSVLIRASNGRIAGPIDMDEK